MRHQNTRNLAALNRLIGYTFRSEEWLQQALTHRSNGMPNNERLEFLGDSVLNCVIAESLYRNYPKLNEGDLSRLRAHLVKEQTLAEIALKLKLGDYLLLGEGELKSGGFRRPSILADTLEAIIGAIFLDSDFNEARKVILGLYIGLFEGLDPRTLGKDPKTLLQEYLQSRKLGLPLYSIVSTSGDAHEQVFHIECLISELNVCTEGKGHSKRSAEQNAAQAAYQLITHA
ncbi:MAG: ribonuclease III [Sulfuricellaceae bacterium]|nr:ribonuclease III [Sulfuricellaceae bacterium]